jgi:CDP-diglyceride synthetase
VYLVVTSAHVQFYSFGEICFVPLSPNQFLSCPRPFCTFIFLLFLLHVLVPFLFGLSHHHFLFQFNLQDFYLNISEILLYLWMLWEYANLLSSRMIRRGRVTTNAICQTLRVTNQRLLWGQNFASKNVPTVWDLTLSRWWLSRLVFSGVWRRVVW